MSDPVNQPTKFRLFLRVQKECLRRSVTPYVMYLMMSLLLLACQAIPNVPLRLILSVLCILAGMAYNTHLCYTYGKMHYDAYLTGAIHRQNALFGIQSGGDHREEREFRPYKGFLIGFYTAMPALIFGILSGCFPNAAGTLLTLFVMFAGWAIIPVSWMKELAHLNISNFVSIAFIAIPILVSGFAYLWGAMKEKRVKLAEAERLEKVAEVGKKSQK